MSLVVDKVEYFTIEVGNTFIEIGEFENLVKNFDRIRKLLVECGGGECWIDATNGVRVEDSNNFCREYVVGGVRVTDCSTAGAGDVVERLGVGSGTVWVSDYGVGVSEEIGADDVNVSALSVEKAAELLDYGRSVLRRFREMYAGAERVSVDVDGGCSVEVYVNDVRYVLPCDWGGGDFPAVDGVEVGVLYLNGEEPLVSGMKEVDGVVYHLFMVPVRRVDELIERWRPVAEAVGAVEFEVGVGIGFVLEPFLAGVRGNEVGYFIEDRYDLKGAERFFSVVGMKGKFDYEMGVIACLLEGFDGGLFEKYRS